MDWLDIVSKLFELVVFPVMAATAAYFITWLRVKKQELQKKSRDDTTKKYLDMLEQTITECVLATNQTYVDALKKEGKFDAAAQKIAFQLTFSAVKSVLTDDAQKYLNEVVKDLNAYITAKIEAKVGTMKK